VQRRKSGVSKMATRTDVQPSALSVQSARGSRLTLAQRRAINGYIFISPFILGFLFWFLIPALVAVYLTFQDWNLIQPPEYVGLANIERLFTDPLLPQTLKVTFVYTFLSVPLGLAFSFFLAMLINTKVRGIAFFRTIYYLPSIVPAVANAVLWAWIFNTEFGLMNVVVRGIGGPKIPWLQNPSWALPAIIIMSLWAVGGPMIIFLAGLQGIPDIYYEAAEIDGAGRWAKLRHITLPLMSPIIFFNLVIGFIGSFQVFTAGFLITDGGPQNATLFLVLYIYRTGFRNLNMGYAATLSWLLFIILMGLSFIVFRYIGNRIYYETPGE
jgi:multiple sugar transport system permease protein